MKKKYLEYYKLTDDEYKKLWDECLFVFDTNVLLNLYRYSNETSKKLLEIISKFSERIWIPYQVGKEYQENRLEVICTQENAYENVKKIFNEHISKLKDEIVKKFPRHPFLNINEIHNSIDQCLEKIYQTIDKQKKEHPDWFVEDSIREEITKLFENKVGDNYNEEKLTELYDMAERRFNNAIPPGYKDDNKNDEKKYGDFIIWQQIIEKAIEVKMPIIFITDDKKEDWWWKVSGKTVGPRPEMIKEFFLETNNQFYMYQVDQFIKYASKYLKSDVEQNVINEIKEVSEEKKEEEEDTMYRDISQKKEIDMDINRYMTELYSYIKQMEMLNEKIHSLRAEKNYLLNISRELYEFKRSSTNHEEEKDCMEKLNLINRDLDLIENRIYDCEEKRTIFRYRVEYLYKQLENMGIKTDKLKRFLNKYKYRKIL